MDVAGAIGALEARGYLHRDITPWNIGQVNGRLFDLSIAKVGDELYVQQVKPLYISKGL